MISWTELAKAAISQKSQIGTAKTDETTILRLLAVLSAPAEAVFELPQGILTVLAVPSPIVLEKHDSAIPVIEDPERWCWPRLTAMNGAEFDLFAQRVTTMQGKGITSAEAENLADKLVNRDRESDDRRHCLECTHLHGYGPQSWRCGAWQEADVAIRLTDAHLPADLVVQLQRCQGFTANLSHHHFFESEVELPN